MATFSALKAHAFFRPLTLALLLLLHLLLYLKPIYLFILLIPPASCRFIIFLVLLPFYATSYHSSYHYPTPPSSSASLFPSVLCLVSSSLPLSYLLLLHTFYLSSFLSYFASFTSIPISSSSATSHFSWFFAP